MSVFASSAQKFKIHTTAVCSPLCAGQGTSEAFPPYLPVPPPLPPKSVIDLIVSVYSRNLSIILWSLLNIADEN